MKIAGQSFRPIAKVKEIDLKDVDRMFNKIVNEDLPMSIEQMFKEAGTIAINTAVKHTYFANVPYAKSTIPHAYYKQNIIKLKDLFSKENKEALKTGGGMAITKEDAEQYFKNKMKWKILRSSTAKKKFRNSKKHRGYFKNRPSDKDRFIKTRGYYKALWGLNAPAGLQTGEMPYTVKRLLVPNTDLEKYANRNSISMNVTNSVSSLSISNDARDFVAKFGAGRTGQAKGQKDLEYHGNRLLRKYIKQNVN